MKHDEWRISGPAIEAEMQRLAGVLQKSIQFQSRTSAAHTCPQRQEAALPRPNSLVPATPIL